MTTTGTTLAGDAVKELVITDFTEETSDLGWFVVNDNVMGGRSLGAFQALDSELHFKGVTNTNGGGFSSIRTHAVYVNLADYEGIRLRVKGDGRRYTWRLTTDARFHGRAISYWADFDTRDGGWTTVDIPFSNFEPRFRGFALEGPALDPRTITGMGLMIYDKQDGPFELHLQSVGAYPADSLTTSLSGRQRAGEDE
jgi:monofunctional biosynthetic peptidoglycan transglycosylase